jgi:2-methylcitrate dehydratase PrpD
MAAFCGATAANALDYEDGHYRGGGIHAGSTVLPTLLAVAPPATSADRLRASLVVGYEIAIRAGYLLSPDHGRPYRTSGHAASIGAAAAAAALLSGDVASVTSAVRIAASHAPVSTVHAGGSCESIGWAAATAVTAAHLAVDGFTDESADAVLAAPVHGTPFDDDSNTALIESLGAASEAVNCYVKPFACCRLIHAALDGLADLRVELGDVESVESIVVGTLTSGAAMTNHAPSTLEQAQFSVPTMVALYLLDGEVGPRQARRERWTDPIVRRLADRVSVRYDPRTDDRSDRAYPATLEVRVAGRTLDHAVWDASGSVTNPISDGERLAKARGCLAPILGPSAADAVVDAVLDRTDVSVAELHDLVTHPLPIERTAT